MAQFLRPIADLTVGTWTTTPLWENVDEVTFDDADFITSPNNSNTTCDLDLSTASSPDTGTRTVRIRVRKGAAAGNTRGLDYNLKENGVSVQSGTVNAALTETFTTFEIVITGAVTDYSLLSLELISTGTTGGQSGNRRTVEVSWAEFEIPDAPAAVYNESITETATLADAPNSIATFASSVTETATLADTTNGDTAGATYNESITETASLTDSVSTYGVQILSMTKGFDASDATTRNATYPSGIQRGDLLIALVTSHGGISPVISASRGSTYFGKNWRGWNATSPIGLRIEMRYALGDENTKDDGVFAITTSVAEKCSWMILRCTPNTMFQFSRVTTGTAVSTIAHGTNSFKSGLRASEYLVLNATFLNSNAQPTGASSNGTFVDSVVGADTDGVSIYLQKNEISAIANDSFTWGTQTIDESTDFASYTLTLLKVEGNDLDFYKYYPSSTSGVSLNSTTPVQGVSMSFVGDGSLIKKIAVPLRRTGAVTGTIRLKIYEASGALNSNIPSGTALATSDTTVDPTTFTSNQAFQIEEFVFNTPFRTVSNRLYVFTVECSDVSGASIQVSTHSTNSRLGNASSSADLSTWTVGGNDLAFFIQSVKNSSPYFFKSNFDGAATPNNNTLNGWEQVDELPFTNNSSLSAGITTYLVQDVRDDATIGRKVFYGRTINDNVGTSDVERAQLTIPLFEGDGIGQEDVEHWKIRMKLHPDIEHLHQYSTNFGAGAWLSILEEWGVANPDWGGNTSGSWRISLGFDKLTGVGNPLFWTLTGELMQPTEFTGMFVNGTQQAGKKYENTSIAVPYNKWFTLSWYKKRGNNTTGRVIITLQIEDEAPVILFDITDHTAYPNEPTLHDIDRIQPIKVYAGDVLLDWMAAETKELSINYSDFTWYNVNAIHVEEEMWMTDTIDASVSAGNTYNESVSESGSLADTDSSAYVGAVSVSESGSLADIFASAYIVIGAVSESGSLADVFASTYTVIGAVSESGSLTDTQDWVVAGLNAMVESGSLSDSFASTYTVIGAVSESGVIAETTNGTVVQRIVKFELWSNTDPFIYLRDLVDNDIIDPNNGDYGPLSTIAIRAITNPNEAVGSVVFALTGASTHNSTDSTPPYFLYGDNGIDANPWGGTYGTHTLVATPYTGAGGGGDAGTPLTINFTIAQIYNYGVVESSTLTDSVSSAMSAIVAIIESASIQDSLNGTLSVIGILSESASIADQTNSTLSTIGVISELVNASDSVASTISILSVISEIGAIVESVNGLEAGVEEVLELLSLIDSVSSSILAAAAITESASLTDLSSAALSRIGIVNESTTINDTVSALAVYSRIISEVATIADSLDVVVAGGVSELTESGSLQDLVSAILTLGVSNVVESMNLSHSQAYVNPVPYDIPKDVLLVISKRVDYGVIEIGPSISVK